MGTAAVLIRECRKADLRTVGEICAAAGFGGQDIGTSGVFADRRLFALLFSDFYVRYEQATSFVAVCADDRSSIVGRPIQRDTPVALRGGWFLELCGGSCRSPSGATAAGASVGGCYRGLRVVFRKPASQECIW